MARIDARLCGEGSGVSSFSQDLAHNKMEKIGVPRFHGQHASWELLPQICVVSVNDSGEMSKIAQDYGALWIKVIYIYTDS
jgi:hypothetical protein